MPNLESIKRGIVRECEEDHVGLWSIVRDVEEAYPSKDLAAVRRATLKILYDLLVRRQVSAGYPTETGKFRSLRLPPAGLIARIEAEWPADRRPAMGESVWFTKPRAPARKGTAIRGDKKRRQIRKGPSLTPAHARRTEGTRSART